MDSNDKLYQVRLECLKLANVKHAVIADVLNTAKEYERFIREGEQKSNKSGTKKSTQDKSGELLK